MPYTMISADTSLTTRAREFAELNSTETITEWTRTHTDPATAANIEWAEPGIAAAAAIGKAQGMIMGLLAIIANQQAAIERGERINGELAEMLAGPRDVR